MQKKAGDRTPAKDERDLQKLPLRVSSSTLGEIVLSGEPGNTAIYRYILALITRGYCSYQASFTNYMFLIGFLKNMGNLDTFL
jgi:hypothetical protein